MGLRGPAPKPTALKMLNGGAQNTLEPRPDRVAPEMPKHLDAEAQEQWKSLSSMLLRIGVLTEADQMSLACLCQAWSTMVKAQTKLSETGMLLKTPSGYVQQSPLISIINNCSEVVTKLSREFGLTPAARTRITVNKELYAPQGITARSIIDIARRRSSELV